MRVETEMDRKRQLALVIGTIAIALGAGHLVQRGASAEGTPVAAAATPTAIEPVSAGAEAMNNKPAIVTASPAPAKVAPTATPAAPAQIVVADLSPAPAPMPAPTALIPAQAVTATTTPTLSTIPDAPMITTVKDTELPAATPVQSVAVTPAETCPVTLKLAAAPQAMIGVSLMAPCAPNARVVIGQAGLSITAKTNADGALFLSIPALAVDAKVTARLAATPEVAQSVHIPAMATLRRFGVQWQNQDAFQVHAFENGADYGQPGDVFADVPQSPVIGQAEAGGFLTLLGDASVNLPMMAEIYTFPEGLAANAEVVIEAAVTEATCGRELLGETIMTMAGEAYVTELTLAMPDCDAVGDILVLKNLMTDLTIAAAN
jgi:hypothetical protein